MFLKNILQKNLAYFIPVLILLLTGILFLLLFSKTESHLVLNAWYSPFWDYFFTYGTYLGDGLIFIPLCLAMMLVRWRFFAGLLTAALLVLLLTAFFKQVVFEGLDRPVKYFEGSHELRLVEGMDMARHNAFPSGHTTTAFAVFGFLACMMAAGWAKFLCFLAAAVAGYSRIYLSQHFLMDVIGGAILGTAIAVFSFYVAQRIGYRWADRNLLRKKETT